MAQSNSPCDEQVLGPEFSLEIQLKSRLHVARVIFSSTLGRKRMDGWEFHLKEWNVRSLDVQYYNCWLFKVKLIDRSDGQKTHLGPKMPRGFLFKIY